MSIKAFFVDFYGTIVHEDGEVIKSITKIIREHWKKNLWCILWSVLLPMPMQKN